MLKVVLGEFIGFAIGVAIWVIVGTSTEEVWLMVVSMLAIFVLTIVSAVRIIKRAQGENLNEEDESSPD